MTEAEPRPPTGATRVGALIGHPVRHSLSPALHNAAFAAAGLDWVFVAFDVAAPLGEAAIGAARALGVEGLSVTMPHKEAAARAVDRLDPVATRLGAVNTVAREGEELVGYNTDGGGFLDALRADLGWTPKRQRCVVVGAGGAARAVVLALAEGGASQVTIVNRTPARAAVAAGLAGSVGRVGAPSDASSADLVVNATPLGMKDVDTGRGGDLVGSVVDALRGSGQVVADLVYHPQQTALLASAAERGAVTTGGLGMLVHQAARAFALWTGCPAPVDVMRGAAEAALRRDPV